MFSPDDPNFGIGDEELNSLLDLTDKLKPPNWSSRDDVQTITVTVDRALLAGKTKKTEIVKFPPLGLWSQDDVNEIGYVAKQALRREAGEPLPFVPEEDFSPGVRQFGRLMQQGGQFYSSYRGTIRELLDTAVIALRGRDHLGGGATILAAANEAAVKEAEYQQLNDSSMILELTLTSALQFPTRDDYRHRRAADDPKRSRAAFLKMKLWDTEPAEPTWIEVPSGRWLTVSSKKVKDRMLVAPDGCCALWAMSATGNIDVTQTLKERPSDWVGASVEKMVRHLMKHNAHFRFYDSIGRLVMTHESSQAVGRYMVANGHVYPFCANAKNDPLKLVPVEKQGGFTDVHEVLRSKFALRGSNSIEVSEFYQNCGIRAPIYKSVSANDFRVQIDLNKAYPSVLLDPTSVFPVFDGKEDVQEYDERQVGRRDIQPTGFYLLRLKPFTTHGERIILAGGAHQAWLYGDMLLRTWPNVEEFPVSGEFVGNSSAPGKPFTPTEAKALHRSILVDILKKEITVEGETPLARKERLDHEVRSELYGTMNTFTGYMEKVTSNTITSVGVPSLEMEFAYIRASARSHLDYESNINPITVPDKTGKESWTTAHLTTYRQGRAWLQTARPAKLAIYSYIAGRLIGGWREMLAKDPGAQICSVQTDCLAVKTTYARTYECVQPGVLGKFHLERNLNAIKPNEEKDELDSLSMLVLDVMAKSSKKDDAYYQRTGAPRPVEVVPQPARSAVPPVLADTTFDDLVESLKAGNLESAALYGPPGCGKTYSMSKWVMAALKEAGRVPVMMAEYTNHVDRLNTGEFTLDACTTAGFLGPTKISEETKLTTTCDFNQLRVGLSKRMVIIEEVGLLKPHYLAMLHSLNPGGIILIGDPYQLMQCGNLNRLAHRFKARVVRMEPHLNDRFGGCPLMHGFVKLCMKAIDRGDAEDNQYWPILRAGEPSFRAQVNDFLTIVNTPAEGAEDIPDGDLIVMGCRHRYTTGKKSKLFARPFKGSYTVSSAQGATFKDKYLLLVDWEAWSPRLLMTAVSRMGDINKVRLLRNLPTQADIDWVNARSSSGD